MINACVQTWSRRGERRRFLLKRETARRDKQASSLLFFSVQRRRFSRPVLSFHNGASTQLDWNSIRTSSANITGRKTGASRDARQQVGNWYRRQSVSQPGSRPPPLLRDTKRFHRRFVSRCCCRGDPVDPWPRGVPLFSALPTNL